MDLLDPEAPVHPPAGMTTDQCLALRAKFREQNRQDGLAEMRARRSGRGLNRAELDREDRAQFRIAHAEDRREGRDL